VLPDGGLQRCADSVHADVCGHWLRGLLSRPAIDSTPQIDATGTARFTDRHPTAALLGFMSIAVGTLGALAWAAATVAHAI